MSDLESALRKIRLREPSATLDERVLGFETATEGGGCPKPRSVPLWVAGWAVAASGLVGIALGFFLAPNPAWAPQTGEASAPSPVTSSVFYRSEAGSNPFDFTAPSQCFLDGELHVKLFTTKG